LWHPNDQFYVKLFDQLYIYVTVLGWILFGCTVTAAFRGLTEAFPRIGYSVALLLGALAIGGACAFWMAHFKTPVIHTSLGLVFVLERGVSFTMTATLAGGRATAALMGFPTRKVARRFCDLMTLYMFGYFLCITLLFPPFDKRHTRLLSSFVSTYDDAVLAGLSAFWLFRKSDREEDLLPAVWTRAVERPKAELLQTEGREEISRLLGANVKRDEE
jgi:hypothetical protein